MSLTERKESLMPVTASSMLFLTPFLRYLSLWKTSPREC